MLKFQTPKSNIFRDMNYFLVTFGKVQTPDRQTESDAYEPTVQLAQVGSKMILSRIKDVTYDVRLITLQNTSTPEQLS